MSRRCVGRSSSDHTHQWQNTKCAKHTSELQLKGHNESLDGKQLFQNTIKAPECATTLIYISDIHSSMLI